MPQVDEFVSVSEAKNKLLDLIRRMKHSQEVIAITRWRSLRCALEYGAV